MRRCLLDFVRATRVRIPGTAGSHRMERKPPSWAQGGEDQALDCENFRKKRAIASPRATFHLIQAILRTDFVLLDTDDRAWVTQLTAPNSAPNNSNSSTGNSDLNLVHYILPLVYYIVDITFIMTRRLRFISPRSSYLMKYGPAEDERHAVLLSRMQDPSRK